MENSNQPNKQFAKFQPTSQPESNFGEELKTSSEPQSTIVAKVDGTLNPKNKPSKIIIVTLAGLLLMIGVISVGGYYFEQKISYQEILDPERPPVGTTVSPTVGIVRPTSTTELNIDMLTYSNQDYGYQVSYPKSWFLNTENETMKDIMIGTKSEVYFLVSDVAIPSNRRMLVPKNSEETEADKQKNPDPLGVSPRVFPLFDPQSFNEPFPAGIVIEASLCDRSPECKSQELYINSLRSFHDSITNEGEFEDLSKKYRIEKITFAGSPALRIDNVPNTTLTPQRLVVILGPTHLIKIWTPIVDPSDPDYAVFDQMVASFKLQ